MIWLCVLASGRVHKEESGLSWLTLAVAAALLGGFEVEQDGVHVSVDIESSNYYYRVTNVEAEPITSFEVRHHGAYNPQAPDGWEHEMDGPSFRAWTTDASTAIVRDATKLFSLRVSSKGAVLGLVEMSLGSAAGNSIVIPQVWGPVPEPQSTVLLIGAVVLVIVLLHSWLLARWDRKRAADSV